MLSAPQRSQDGQTLPLQGFYTTEAAGRPLAAMVADTSTSATTERLVGCSQVSGFHSEAGRRRYRLPWLQKRTPAGLSPPPEGQRPLAAFRFPPGSQCGRPGSRFPTIYHAHLVKDGPRPRPPVSEHFPSDRTVQLPCKCCSLAAPRVAVGAGAWGSLPLRQRMAHQATSFSTKSYPDTSGYVPGVSAAQAGSGMPRGTWPAVPETHPKLRQERRSRPDEKHP